MLVTVLVVFIICWTPQQILVFYSAIYPEEYNQVQFTIIVWVIRILSNKKCFWAWKSAHTAAFAVPHFFLVLYFAYHAVCGRCEHYNSLRDLSQMTFYFIQLTTVEVYPVIYLAYANSALNPLIYGGLNNNLRQRAAALLRKLCCCCTDSNRISPAGNISYSETSAVRV